MVRRSLPLTVFVALVAGCSSAGSPPLAPAVPAQAPSASYSAVRAPEDLLANPVRRRALGNAIPFSTTANPYPISALASAGSPPASSQPACAVDAFFTANCKAEVNSDDAVVAEARPNSLSIPGVQPGLLRFIYGVSATAGSRKSVIAVVVAYDDPNAAADLANYRGEFGMTACTVANGCFTKVVENGGPLPTPNANWSVEASLDLDAASAMCPACSLMLVEAASNQIPDLAAAVDTAVARGATVVSNSYGVAEASDNAAYASHYVHAGVPIVAAAGDLGYGAQFPASVPSVTAVGGTSIQQIGGGAIQEVVWPQTGSGCSAFFAKPAWQKDTLCSGRTLNDVSMLADPTDGISVYDSSIPGTAAGGWFVVGGTSLAAPLVASLFALAEAHGVTGSNSGIYKAAGTSLTVPAILDVTLGSNGSCSPAGLCTAETGYDGPSGNGVPWGVTAFSPPSS